MGPAALAHPLGRVHSVAAAFLPHPLLTADLGLPLPAAETVLLHWDV